MRRLTLLCILIFSDHSLHSQQGMWTWMNGSTNENPLGVYGTQGVPSVLNSPAGGYEGAMGTDKAGNFWFFSGFNTGVYDDLWKFTPATNEWTWMKGSGNTFTGPVYGTQGIPAISNSPGNQQWCAAAWVDTAGNFWIFGGSDGGGTSYNLLWKYDPAINMWSWEEGSTTCCTPGNYGTKGIASPTNQPPSRWETNAAWVDSSNNLWLFGGFTTTGDFNDLWKYQISTGEWTWVSGSSVTNSSGNYGIKGVPAATNEPPPRKAHSHWKDSDGNFWMFAGARTLGSFNDMWMYNSTTGFWTWMGGTDVLNDVGTFGPNCNADTSYLPKFRFENKASWIDKQGRFWNYGGSNLSDLWVYNPKCNTWALVNGNPSVFTAPVFGTQGIAAPGNEPGGLMGSVSWMDSSDGLWMMGGWNNNYNAVNTLWKFVIDTTCAISFCGNVPQCNLSSSDTLFCEKQCIDFFDLSVNSPTTWQGQFTGGSRSTSTLQNPAGICYNNYGSFDVQLIACNNAGCDTVFFPAFITEFQSPAAPTILWQNDSLICTATNVSYAWYSTLNPNLVLGTNYFYVPFTAGTYYVLITDSNGCAVPSLTIAANVGWNDITQNSIQIVYEGIESNLFLNCPENLFDEYTVTIYDGIGRVVMEIKSNCNSKKITLPETLSGGIFSVQISSSKMYMARRFLKK
ncbi:MAG: hypothetical protein IPP29_01075 [Bacteroidetes bacterium]|nr:hypothetical protein [Bacteroidota bacterium]